MRGDLALSSGFGGPILVSGGPSPELFIPKEVTAAWECDDPHARRTREKSSPAQRAGLAYQKKITKWAQSVGGECTPPLAVRPGVWFCYHDENRRRYCQPDILIEDPAKRTVIVVEVKLRWTANAWWQLTHLYLPVLRRVRGPDWSFVRLCVTKSYDPSVGVAEPVNFCDALLDARSDRFNVLVMR